MTSIRTWWSTGPEPGNLGDVLTPVILRHFGHDPVWTSREKADLLCIGSIVRFAQPGQLVLGSGAMWEHDHPSPSARYLAVRGPLTRDVVERGGGDCPEVYGDPALLLPAAYSPTIRKRHGTGLVPHYVDLEATRSLAEWLPVINPLRVDPLEVVREMLACREILSSSLHGIIVAHAYGIPAAWVRFGNRLDGDDIKFRDYAASVGVELVPYSDIWEAVPVLPKPPDLLPLRKAFTELPSRLGDAA